MAVLMTQDDNASIERAAGGLSNYYLYTMSNDCAISRKKNDQVD